MANLFKATGGSTSLIPTTSWSAPNGLFPTAARNDGSSYSFVSSTSTVTLPSSGLADGYLLVARYEFEDTSNGRCNPQGKVVQASGTGGFVSGLAGGFNRDNSEDRAYVHTWAFVNNPSASATFQFQWKRDTDTPTGGTVRSSIEVIPLHYADIGLYTSTSSALYGGTTPNQVTGFTGTDGTNITLSSNVISVTGDNKRYLVLGSQFFEGRGGRTQRWHGLRIDGVKEDAAKAYSYYRNTSNDESGDMFTWLLETSTATITIDQFCYRGDGVANGDGGADIDGSIPSVGDHALVVLELNDSAEVFRSSNSTDSGDLTSSPTDINVNEVTDFNDADSFTDLVDTSINCVQTADYLFGGNVSAASNNVANTQRWTAYSELHVNGTEDATIFGGDYLRNDQSTTSTFGWSANLMGFTALTAGDDVGLSVTQLTGSEAGGDAITPAGWTGFWGLNLDTLEAAASSQESLKSVSTSGSTDFKFPSIPSTTTIVIGFWHKNEPHAGGGDYTRANKNTLFLSTATGESLWIVGNATSLSGSYYANDNAVVEEDGLGSGRYVGDIAFFQGTGYTEDEIEGWTYHVHMYHYDAAEGEITYGSWARVEGDTDVREEAYAVWTRQELRDFADGIADPHPTSSGISGNVSTAQAADMAFAGVITSIQPLLENSTRFSTAVTEDTTNYFKDIAVFTSSTKPTDSQILAWSESSASSPPSGAWGFYPLVDSGSITVNDFSGNGRHLTNDSTATLSVATIEPNPTATVPTSISIQDAGDENHAANEIGVVLTGVLFGATQGSGKVEIGSTSTYGTATLKELNVTAWSDTSLTVDIGLGVEHGLTIGTLFLYVTNDDDEVSGAYTTTIYEVFDYYRQDVIDAFVSAQSETNGWNAELGNIPLTAVVRTNNTVATITLPALPDYVITANETIAAPTIVGGILTGGQDIDADVGFTITNEAATTLVSATYSGANSIRSNVTSSYSAASTVRGNVTATLNGASSVRNYASSTFSAGYTLRNNITSSFASSSRVLGFVAGSYAGAYSVAGFSSVTATFSSANSIRGSITSDYDGASSVREFVSDTFGSNNSVRAYASSNYASTNVIYNFASSSFASGWTVRAYTDASLSLGSRVYNYVSADYSGAFSVGGFSAVTSSYASSNSVRSYLVSSDEFSNSVRRFVGADYSTENTVYEAASATYSSSNTVRGFVSGTIGLSNTARSFINDEFSSENTVYNFVTASYVGGYSIDAFGNVTATFTSGNTVNNYVVSSYTASDTVVNNVSSNYAGAFSVRSFAYGIYNGSFAVYEFTGASYQSANTTYAYVSQLLNGAFTVYNFVTAEYSSLNSIIDADHSQYPLAGINQGRSITDVQARPINASQSRPLTTNQQYPLSGIKQNRPLG